MDTGLGDFAKTVGTRGDHRQTTGERFQTGIGKWIVNCRQNKNVRSSVDAQDICYFAEKLHRLFAPKAQSFGFVESFISTAGNEQPHLAVSAKRRRFDCEKQALARPTRANKQQRG